MLKAWDVVLVEFDHGPLKGMMATDEKDGMCCVLIPYAHRWTLVPADRVRLVEMEMAA